MNEIEEKIITEDGGTEDQDFNLLNEVEELRKNSVSKEQYQKLVEKNKMLMKRIVEGGGQEEKANEPVDLQKIREEIFGDNVETLSNREFWEKVLTLRHERLKEGVDIFLPKGSRTRYTREDYESANKVDEIISQMLEDSKGDPRLFNSMFNDALN